MTDACLAQTNLDFEALSDGQPLGWTYVGSGYRVTVDRSEFLVGGPETSQSDS
jgi:hypothetical protein